MRRQYKMEKKNQMKRIFIVLIQGAILLGVNKVFPQLVYIKDIVALLKIMFFIFVVSEILSYLLIKIFLLITKSVDIEPWIILGGAVLSPFLILSISIILASKCIQGFEIQGSITYIALSILMTIPLTN